MPANGQEWVRVKHFVGSSSIRMPYAAVCVWGGAGAEGGPLHTVLQQLQQQQLADALCTAL